MRTTVTVDPDVEELLRTAMQASGQSFKVTVNEAIRRGLAGTVVESAEGPFRVEPLPMGLRAGIDPGRVGELGDDHEIDAFLELTRSLSRNASAT